MSPAWNFLRGSDHLTEPIKPGEMNKYFPEL